MVDRVNDEEEQQTTLQRPGRTVTPQSEIIGRAIRRTVGDAGRAFSQDFQRGGLPFAIGGDIRRGVSGVTGAVQRFADFGGQNIVRPIVESGQNFLTGLAGTRPATEALPPIQRPGAQTPATTDGNAIQTSAEEAPVVGGQPAQAGVQGPQIPQDIIQLSAPTSGGDIPVFRRDTQTPEEEAEFGQAILSDTPGGTTPAGFRQSATPTGVGLVRPGSGPFGRTQEQQAQIQQNVASLDRAAETFRDINRLRQDRETDGDRVSRRRRALESRALRRPSLNQSLSSFLETAADRNIARRDLERLDEGEAQSQQLLAEQNQQQVEQALALQRLALEQQKANQEAFGVTNVPLNEFGDPSATPVIFNRRTGEAAPLDLAQQAPQFDLSDITDEDIAFTAQEEGITEDEVRARLGI